MKAALPVIRGVIKRRILVNFRVDARVLTQMLPAPFRPKQAGGFGMIGICLIALRHIRPAAIPFRLGLASENAAHRVAVEWSDNGAVREGVYIPRRDTSSVLQALAGGKVFPGVHHRSAFHVTDNGSAIELRMESQDGILVHVAGEIATELPRSSIFSDLDEASEFFRRGSLGYSTAAQPGRYDGLELRSYDWHVTPLAIQTAKTTFFSRVFKLPETSCEFDCALLMRDIDHEWHAQASLFASKGNYECCI